jgi:hypothetical protein
LVDLFDSSSWPCLSILTHGWYIPPLHVCIDKSKIEMSCDHPTRLYSRFNKLHDWFNKLLVDLTNYVVNITMSPYLFRNYGLIEFEESCEDNFSCTNDIPIVNQGTRAKFPLYPHSLPSLMNHGTWRVNIPKFLVGTQMKVPRVEFEIMRFGYSIFLQKLIRIVIEFSISNIIWKDYPKDVGYMWYMGLIKYYVL